MLEWDDGVFVKIGEDVKTRNWEQSAETTERKRAEVTMEGRRES